MTESATLDATDRKLLRLLQRDGRATNVQLAKAANLSESACLRRVRALEEKGVISRYAAVIDERAVGLPLSVSPSPWPRWPPRRWPRSRRRCGACRRWLSAT